MRTSSSTARVLLAAALGAATQAAIIPTILHSNLNLPSTTSQPASGGVSLNLLGDAGKAVDTIVQGIAQDSQELRKAASAYYDIIASRTVSAQAPTPTAVEAVFDTLKDIFLPLQPNGRGNPRRGVTTSNDLSHITPPGLPLGLSIVDDALDFLVNSIAPQSNRGIIGAVSGKTNSFNNQNTRKPRQSIYPKKSPFDAPYSATEKDLRSAIYIPSGFTYGRKKPVILFPGTGTDGGDNFAGNLIPLLQDSEFDIVWVNVPGFMMGDAQVNGEYAAYAINYIAGITNRKVSVISWSQGGLSNQWALKYWPSTRGNVEDFVPVSGDFKGTVMAYYLCPGFPALPCDPSILQQKLGSNFINTLRSNGGDSAYVPTTAIYSSIFDEIVQPQTGTGASGFMKNGAARASNNEVQAICPLMPAGAFQTHESLLTSSITYALIIDALTHDGPGQISRLDLKTICAKPIADGLGVTDLLATEATIPQAAANILLYFPKYISEPPIAPYAR